MSIIIIYNSYIVDGHVVNAVNQKTSINRITPDKNGLKVFEMVKQS